MTRRRVAGWALALMVGLTGCGSVDVRGPAPVSTGAQTQAVETRHVTRTAVVEPVPATVTVTASSTETVSGTPAPATTTADDGAAPGDDVRPVPGADRAGYAGSHGYPVGTGRGLSSTDPLAGARVLRTSSGSAGFVTPSGNIACVIRGEAVLCQIRTKTYTAASADTESRSCDTGLRAGTAGAGFICGDGDLGWEADVTGGNVGWWRPSLGKQTRTNLGDSYQAAVLPYGMALEAPAGRCRVDYEGVSCWFDGTEPRGARAFFLSRQRYLIQRQARTA